MSKTVRLGKYSIGVGDRFAQQAGAQLKACQLALERGVEIEPVWNKSNREHLIIGSEPARTRAAADAAVKGAGWDRPYHVDADHIRLETVGRFLSSADFFTLDVADAIGKPSEPAKLNAFAGRHPELVGKVSLPGMEHPLETTRSQVTGILGKYQAGVEEAGRLYRHIAAQKGEGSFITEVSMDETDRPQAPLELLVILAALADERVPLQTIAPKFSGRFNKGVDYVGEVSQFEKEFNADLAVLAFAVKQYGLPGSLKLSIHSGSDKFSLYRPIQKALVAFDAGVHLKTAGTTWLEELIGLAEAGGTGLTLAREIYAEALAHVEELCAPYATVIDIDRKRLPSAEMVNSWDSSQFVAALRHDSRNPAYNPHFRQLLHVGYKVAAHLGSRYLEALAIHRESVARNVTQNLFDRHIQPLFPGL